MAAETAVIVNEAGEIGLDGAILREVGDIPMALLSNGCVCCQAGNDLVYTIDALLRAERPGTTSLRRIVLETSGLAKPGPCCGSSRASPGCRCGSRCWRRSTPGAARRSRPSLKRRRNGRRRTGSSRPSWTWCPRPRGPGIGRAYWPLSRRSTHWPRWWRNPTAPAPGVAAAFAPLGSPAMAMPDITDPQDAPQPGHNHVSVRLARPAQPLDYNDLATWLDNLAGVLGERLLRLKGVVPVEGAGPMLIQSVGTLFAPPAASPPQARPSWW